MNAHQRRVVRRAFSHGRGVLGRRVQSLYFGRRANSSRVYNRMEYLRDLGAQSLLEQGWTPEELELLMAYDSGRNRVARPPLWRRVLPFVLFLIALTAVVIGAKCQEIPRYTPKTSERAAGVVVPSEVGGMVQNVTAQRQGGVGGVVPVLSKTSHRFLDKTNVSLFAGVAVARGLDLHSTWAMRRAGWQEVELSNSIVDNKSAFTAFTAGVFAAHVGGCYLLHRAGHHRLERIASVLHIAGTSATVASNYRLAGK